MAWPARDEAPVELEARHAGHMYVGDQTGRFGEATGGEEIGSARECIDAEAQRPHQPPHRLAKEAIVFDNRDQ